MALPTLPASTYTSSKGQSGAGVLLYIGGVSGVSSGETFAIVTEVMDLPVTLPKWKTADTTNLQSSVEESSKTLLGLTTISVKGNRVPSDAGQLAIQAAYASKQPYDFIVVFPKNAAEGQTTVGDSFTFSALVFELQHPVHQGRRHHPV